MDLVQIDVVSAEAAQAGVELTHDGPADRPAPFGPGRILSINLGCNNHIVASRKISQRPSQDSSLLPSE